MLVYGVIKSDPTKADTDGDGLLDYQDPYPMQFNNWSNYDRDAVFDYCEKYALYPNKNDYCYFDGGDCANFVSQCLYSGGIKMNKDWEFVSKGTEIFGRYLGDEYTHSWSVTNDNYEYFKNNLDVTYGKEIIFTSKEDMKTALENNL